MYFLLTIRTSRKTAPMAIKLIGRRFGAAASVGALALSLVVVGGAATASTAAEEVHACVHKKTRYARIVNPTTKCRVTEIRVTWGAGGDTLTGTGGPVGPAGKDGKTGAQGPAGKDGAQGPAGPKGDKGIQGVAGPAGKNGEDGKPGAAGPKGDTGPAGPKGDDGKPGLPGKDGTNGTNGTNGKDGATGPAGPKGEKGEPGKDGASAVYTTYSQFSSISNLGTVTATCKAGDVATGGGFSFTSFKNVRVIGNAPSGTTGWSVTVEKDDNGYGNNSAAETTTSNHGTSVKGSVYVVCLKKV